MTVSERNRVKVSICNEDYVFISPAEAEHLRYLAELVENRIQDILRCEPRLNLARAAVMAAMIFADGMINEQGRADRLQAQLELSQSEQIAVASELKRAKATVAKRAKRKGRR